MPTSARDVEFVGEGSSPGGSFTLKKIKDAPATNPTARLMATAATGYVRRDDLCVPSKLSQPVANRIQ